jgi:hypothetical protein
MPSNPARSDAKTLQLAAMDFALAPAETIRKELGISQSAISQRRQSELYKTTVEELKQAFKEKMLQTPGSTEIRKTISWALSIAVKKILGILSSPKTSNRDVIGAARLVAQMDGRFLGTADEDGHGKVNDNTESLAAELMKMVNRPKDKVQ